VSLGRGERRRGRRVTINTILVNTGQETEGKVAGMKTIRTTTHATFAEK
jgi:hypothetical protein